MNVLALTGRRIDAADAEVARFPLAHAPAVRRAIETVLREMRIEALVCSAACGTDLLALDAAEKQDISAWIVLPFARERFRETSVVDRPGEWGAKFDHHLDIAEQRGTLHVVAPMDDNHEAYLQAVEDMLDLALSLNNGSVGPSASSIAGHVNALVVRDGASRGPRDVTIAFIAQARQRGIPVRELRS